VLISQYDPTHHSFFGAIAKPSPLTSVQKRGTWRPMLSFHRYLAVIPLFFIDVIPSFTPTAD
jgi:hypothetical protein